MLDGQTNGWTWYSVGTKSTLTGIYQGNTNGAGAKQAVLEICDSGKSAQEDLTTLETRMPENTFGSHGAGTIVINFWKNDFLVKAWVIKNLKRRREFYVKFNERKYVISKNNSR
jgi:hypothetical protein